MELSTLAPPEERWRWHEVPDGDGARVRLYAVDLPALNRAASRCTKNGSLNLKQLQRIIADKWFDDFEKLTAPGGVKLDNTLDMRAAILGDPLIWPFVLETLTGTGELLVEGNAGGGSD